MSSNYTGSATFLATLSLMTDGDSPSAQLFRLPNQALLDNCVYLKAQLEANVARIDADVLATAKRNGVIPRFLVATGGSADDAAFAPLTSIGMGLVFTFASDPAQLDDSYFATVGAKPTGLIEMHGAARASSGTHSGRIVVVGQVASGIKYAAFTDDQSATWTQSFDFGSGGPDGAPLSVIYEPVHGAWLALHTAAIQHSSDGQTWTRVATSGAGTLNASRLVAFSNGNIVTDTDTGTRSMVFSSNGGTSWNTATTPANLTTANYGVLAGNGGANIYHAALLTSGHYQISSTTGAANAWTVLATIAPPSGMTFDDASNGPGLAVDPDSGWIFLLGTNETTSVGYLYASPDGVSWTAPVVLQNPAPRNLFAYRGRAVHVDSTGKLFASDGIGT